MVHSIQSPTVMNADTRRNDLRRASSNMELSSAIRRAAMTVARCQTDITMPVVTTKNVLDATNSY